MSSPDTQHGLVTQRNSPEQALALRPPREYEFLVTTEEPHQAAGTDRQRIRQKVMKSFFEAQKAGPLASTSEISSVSTVQAQTKLKSRFRLSKTGQGSAASKKTGNNQKIARKSEGEKTTRASGRTEASKKTPSTQSETGDNTINFRSLSPTEKSGESPDDAIGVASGSSPLDLDAHLMDPFGVLPVQNIAKLELLFQLYKSGTKLNSVLIACTDTWWPFVANDRGLLHATLASWALYGILMRGVTSVVPEMLGHKTEAIKEINAKINRSNGWISDELIGNVLILATFENLQGEYDSALLHFGALKRMVDMRGGLEAFNHNGGLFRGIVWVDFHNAIALRRPPTFPLVLLEPETPPLPQTLVKEATEKPSTSLLQLTVRPTECFSIFQRMRLLALATTSRYVDEVDRLAFSNMLYELEFSILSTIDYSLDMAALDQGIPRITYNQASPQSEGNNYDGARKTDGENTAAVITEAVLTAALIFICASMRDIPPSAKLYTILLQRLQGALETPSTSIVDAWKVVHNLKILLWALVVGACVAPQQKRVWWIERTGEVMDAMDIYTFGGLEAMLTEVAWTDYTFADALKGVWSQVDEVLRFKES